MYKEYFMFIFVAFIALNFLPYTEKIVFGADEDFSYKDLEQIERFGTEQMTNAKKGSDTSSTNKIIKLIENNKNKYNKSMNKRMADDLLSSKKELFKGLEEMINIFIASTKKNKKLSNRIMNGTFMDSSDFQTFKKDLYSKLDDSNLKSLYEPIKDYFLFLNKDFLPNLIKKIILKNKFKIKEAEKKLIIKMIKEMKKTSFNFTLSELMFLTTIQTEGEHTTLSSKEKIRMIEKTNSKYLKRKNPMYNLSYFIPSLKFEALDKMRFETFLFYLTFLYRKFHKQFIMFRKLSLFTNDSDLKSTYKRFLTKTAVFVSKVNVESLKAFKKVS